MAKHKVPPLDYFIKKAVNLKVSEFEIIARQLQVQTEAKDVQAKFVASFLKSQYEEKQAKKELALQKIEVEPLFDGIQEMAFNALSFALWAMPQKNPIPKPIFDKMRKLRKMEKEGLPISEEDRLTGDESKILLDCIVWKRGDKQFGVRITGTPEHGIVFGQDRLALIWSITRAIQVKAPEVLGFEYTDYLNYFTLDKHGRAYDETEERFQRLKNNLILAWWTDAAGNRYELMTNYLSDYLIIRPKKDKDKYNPLSRNYIRLSATLWAEVAKKRIVQLDADVLRKLKGSPGALDLYQFGASKIFRLERALAIPLLDASFHLGMKPEQPLIETRRKFKTWIHQVNEATGWKMKLSKAGKKDVFILPPNHKQLPQ